MVTVVFVHFSNHFGKFLSVLFRNFYNHDKTAFDLVWNWYNSFVEQRNRYSY